MGVYEGDRAHRDRVVRKRRRTFSRTVPLRHGRCHQKVVGREKHSWDRVKTVRRRRSYVISDKVYFAHVKAYDTRLRNQVRRLVMAVQKAIDSGRRVEAGAALLELAAWIDKWFRWEGP